MEPLVAHKRCLDSLVWAIEQLQGQAETSQLEQIAELVILSMTGPWRYFHTPDHIFEVGGCQDAIEVLAALFHDLVYVQVDHGTNLNISRYIAPFIQEIKGELVILKTTDLPKDRLFEIVAAVFGFAPSQTLSPFNGQNEFLSAVVAAKILEPFLSPSLIAEIAVCVEATIPFRSKSQSGLSASELLYQRVAKTNQQFNLGWSEAKTCEVVKRSVRLANRDVENFAFSNSADFLDNTWNLLPETNHELINATSYTIQGYRRSLQKMEGFMNFLKPELVFQQFRGEPDEQIYVELLAKTQKNLEVAKLYLGIKLITIAILEALSSHLGRNIPLSTMMGELPIPGMNTPVLEQFLPSIPIAYQPETPLEVEVLELLSKGRNQEHAYDLKNSPVATFIIKSIGFASIEYLLKQAKEFFSGTISATDFLKECNPDVVKAIARGVSHLFESRASALLEFK